MEGSEIINDHDRNSTVFNNLFFNTILNLKKPKPSGNEQRADEYFPFSSENNF